MLEKQIDAPEAELRVYVVGRGFENGLRGGGRWIARERHVEEKDCEQEQKMKNKANAAKFFEAHFAQ